MLVATLRSKGGVFSDGGPEILDQLDGIERTSVVRRQRELTEMLYLTFATNECLRLASWA